MGGAPVLLGILVAPAPGARVTSDAPGDYRCIGPALGKLAGRDGFSNIATRPPTGQKRARYHTIFLTPRPSAPACSRPAPVARPPADRPPRVRRRAPGGSTRAGARRDRRRNLPAGRPRTLPARPAPAPAPGRSAGTGRTRRRPPWRRSRPRNCPPPDPP